MKHFVIGDVLGFGWRVMKANFWFFVGAALAAALISSLPDILNMFLKISPLPPEILWALSLCLWLVGQVLGIMISIGLTKIALSFCDQLKPPFETLFDAWDCFWRYLGVAIL